MPQQAATPSPSTTREGYVYPGHRVPIALAIMDRYPDLDSALRMGAQYPAALEDGEIPGAGAAVRGALEMLSAIRTGTVTVEQAVAVADRAWACDCDGLYETVHDRGLSEARSVGGRLREHVLSWLGTASAAPQSPSPGIRR